MNYLTCSVHEYNSSTPIYEFCYISSINNYRYLWEFKGNHAFMIPKFPFKPDTEILFLGNIKNAFERNTRTEIEFQFIASAFREMMGNRLRSLKQLQLKKERFDELIPIIIRNSTKGKVPCRRCASGNRKSQNCARLLAIALRQYVEKKKQ